jgi:hypothetical protein
MGVFEFMSDSPFLTFFIILVMVDVITKIIDLITKGK